MIRAARKDENQKGIEIFLKSIGAEYLDCTKMKDAFDLLVGFRGKLYIIEVKNPEYLRKKLSKESALIKALTEGERKCRDKFKKVDIEYYIVSDIEGIKKILGV